MAFFEDDNPYAPRRRITWSPNLGAAVIGSTRPDSDSTPGPINVPMPNAGAIPGYGSPGAARALPVPVMPAYSGGDPADYQGLVDRMLAGLRREAAAATAARRADMGASAQRAIIQFGEVPEGIDKQVSDLLSSDTRGLAQKNTSANLSTVARLNEAHNDAIAGIKNALAARGILSSGELGNQNEREQTAYVRSQFDARNQLLDYLAGLQSAFNEAERAQSWALAQAAMSAAASIPVFPGYAPYGYPGGQDDTGAAPAASPAAAPSAGGYFDVNQAKRNLGYGSSIPWTAGL